MRYNHEKTSYFLKKCFFKNSSKIKKLITLLLLLFIVSPIAYSQNATNKVVIYFFWGDGCPHCAKEKIFLNEIEKKYNNIEIKSYETWYNKENAEFFSKMANSFGTNAQGVPTTFIDNKMWVGYADYIGEEIENKIKYCLSNGCSDPAQKINGYANGDISGVEEGISTKYKINKSIGVENSKIIIPVIGELDSSKISLPVITAIIAGMDSFNPCAFFVLFFLLSMLIYAGSRKRMLLIGGIFVFFSGLVYFFFMAAWLNIFLIMGNIKIITLIAGIIALLIALINIKDFFFFKKGISLVIPEKAKPKLFEKMRNILKKESIITMIMATIILAASANSYELLCTAGFPMVFTRILTLNNLTLTHYYLYLIFYNIIYIIPLLIIVLAFSFTLGARKLTEWEGQVLKLISGMMMLFLSLVLIFNPALLNNIFISLLLLVVAIASSFIIIKGTKKFRKKEEIEKEKGAKDKTKK